METSTENTVATGQEAVIIVKNTSQGSMQSVGTENQDAKETSQLQRDEMGRTVRGDVDSVEDGQCLTPSQSSSGRNSPTPQSAPETSLRENQNTGSCIEFKDCKISIAIDTSGSTLGEVLKREQQAITHISKLLTNPSRDAVRILPWNSSADGAVKLSGLGSLSSYGGTNPMVLLESSPSLVALQDSSLWFLLTDGEIGNHSLQNFAKNFARYKLHGTACVIMVFGPKLDKPSYCNISVGVSVFAIVPDCLFLYQDKSSSDVYLLQCKGRFTEILERTKQEQPVLDDKVDWEDLPRISLSDLACVSIPAPQKIGENEVALEDNLVINLDDLLSDRLRDENIIESILRSQENIRTISLTAQTRGQADQLRNWAIKQELDPEDFSKFERCDIGGRASASISTIIQQIQTGTPMPGEHLYRAQMELRAAHSRNSETLIAAERIVRERSDSISTVVARSSIQPSKGRSISLTGFEPAPTGIVKSSHNWLFNKGFKRSVSDITQFEGTCSLCATEDVILALLLREPPTSLVTPGFPEACSSSKLAFPLAMGKFPETDVISSLVCCDACSCIVAESGETPAGDTVICALPLVSYSANKRAYHTQMNTALDGRFDDEDLPLVFVAVLCTAAYRIRSQGPSSNQLLLNAIEWACINLAGSVQCKNTLSSSFSAPEEFIILKPLNEVLIQASADALQSISSNYLQYPIEGFLVMTMIIESKINSKRPQILLTLKKLVSQRLLFHVAEEYHKHLAEQGPVITHIMMSQLLIQESARRERSPWNMERKGSSFRTLQGLTRSLFGDRKALHSKLSISLDLLTTTPLLTAPTIAKFKKLGPLFDWIEGTSGHALAIFLNFLYRFKNESKGAVDHFALLAGNPSLAKVFHDPADISARMTEVLLESLPPLIQPEAENGRGT